MSEYFDMCCMQPEDAANLLENMEIELTAYRGVLVEIACFEGEIEEPGAAQEARAVLAEFGITETPEEQG